MPWTCTKCKRKFKNPHQWHSCAKFSTEPHFKGKSPHVREIFDALVTGVKGFGKVKVDPVKTMILFGAKSHFAELTVHKNFIRLIFSLHRALDSERIEKIGTMGKYYIHFVKLEEPSEVDQQLLEWLREAYDLLS